MRSPPELLHYRHPKLGVPKRFRAGRAYLSALPCEVLRESSIPDLL
jgi:hypothetical protein